MQSVKSVQNISSVNNFLNIANEAKERSFFSLTIQTQFLCVTMES